MPSTLRADECFNCRLYRAIDLGLLLTAYGLTSRSEDLNEDGEVESADLGLLLGAYSGEGQVCTVQCLVEEQQEFTGGGSAEEVLAAVAESPYFDSIVQGDFCGVISTVPFDKVIVSDPGAGIPNLDNLFFGSAVPAPSPILLLLAAASSCRRRSRVGTSGCRQIPHPTAPAQSIARWSERHDGPRTRAGRGAGTAPARLPSASQPVQPVIARGRTARASTAKMARIEPASSRALGSA